MQRKRVTVFSQRNRVTVRATCFCHFFWGGSFFIPTHKQRKIILNWVLINAVRFFSHCPSSDRAGKQEATIIDGILSLLLPRSRHQIWASGLSAEEIRAVDIQVTYRCNMVSTKQVLGPHRLALPSPGSPTGFSICFHSLCSG